MAKKNKKVTTHKYKVGDYVRIHDIEAIEDLDLEGNPKELYGVIRQVFGALFTNNTTYAEYLICIQGYPNMPDICFYPEQFEKIA